ncbi:unnamed protein product [Vitrella brassicaformis CCMP3155]|uniref:Protein kinase domain-containing protein n=3 Tax=Vitrella brassicaformis TaxID=1169539 RepID=A0A0G4ECS5_VITBC|nr:unnamed protein product [Vitrella brassicaformis CCMP3155]|eukprot:CEL93112.1 unnamed protein product [Vitrella brassicaformis CCMP3155]
MFGFPEVDIGVGLGSCDATRTVFVARNGGSGDPVKVNIAHHAKLGDLLEAAGRKLGIAHPSRCFYESGEEVKDIDSILDDEVLFISEGGGFRKSLNRTNTTTEGIMAGYLLKEKIGEGGFGKVMKAVHMETNQLAAVKFISKKSFREIADADRVFVEIQALRDLSHKHVIQMYDVVDHPSYICFIMEFASNGELREYVANRQRLTEDEARHFFQQIVKGVHYCHSRNIVHRDLKLENILLDDGLKCKIVDFGLSDFVAPSERVVTEGGTEAYLAPEVYHGSSADSDPFKIDVWALGVILYAMTHGKLPFHAPDRVTLEKLEREGLDFRGGCSQAMQALILAMLTADPKKRPSTNDVMMDPWLRQQLLYDRRSDTLPSSHSTPFLPSVASTDTHAPGPLAATVGPFSALSSQDEHDRSGEPPCQPTSPQSMTHRPPRLSVIDSGALSVPASALATPQHAPLSKFSWTSSRDEQEEDGLASAFAASAAASPCGGMHSQDATGRRSKRESAIAGERKRVTIASAGEDSQDASKRSGASDAPPSQLLAMAESILRDRSAKEGTQRQLRRENATVGAREKTVERRAPQSSVRRTPTAASATAAVAGGGAGAGGGRDTDKEATLPRPVTTHNSRSASPVPSPAASTGRAGRRLQQVGSSIVTSSGVASPPTPSSPKMSPPMHSSHRAATSQTPSSHRAANAAMAAVLGGGQASTTTSTVGTGTELYATSRRRDKSLPTSSRA